MHAIKINLKNNKFPATADFRDRPPNNRSKSFRAKWKSTTNAYKAELSLLVLEDLADKYQQTKSEIQGLMIELQQHLFSSQFQEISTFLQEKYKSTMPTALSRTQKRLERPKPGNMPPNNRNPRRPFKKAIRREDSKMDTGKLQNALLKSLNN